MSYKSGDGVGVMGFFVSQVALRARMFLILVCFSLGSIAGGSNSHAASISFTYDEVNDLVKDSLSGLEIRLNNLGRFNGRNHRRRDSSYVRFKGQSLSSLT